MLRACCIVVRDEEACDTRTSEEAKARRRAGTAESRMVDCSQLSIGVVADRLALQVCGQLKNHDRCFLKLVRQARTRTTQQSAPKSISIASKTLIALARFRKISPEQGNTAEQRVLTGNVSRLRESNATNSPMSLTN